MAGALGDLGLDTGHRRWSLAGFNLGVQVAQVGVALAVAVLVIGLRRVRGAATPVRMLRLASFVALAMGSLWFVQRVTGLA